MASLNSIAAKSRVWASILAIVLTGPIVIKLPFVTMFLKEFAMRFGNFLLFLMLWELILWFIVKFIFSASKDRRSYKKIFAWVIAFGLTATLLSFVANFEDKVSPEFFNGLLILFGVRGLARGSKLAGYRLVPFGLNMLYLYGISNFSGALTAAGWQWPFLIFGLSLQAGLHADFCLSSIRQGWAYPDQNIGLSVTALARLHSIALIFAPISVCLMQYFGFLPKEYLITLVSLAFALRAAEQSRKFELERNDSAFAKAEVLSCFATITFLLAFTAATFLNF